MRVLVCGDRNWTDQNAITDRLAKLPQETTIIEGCARGADSFAESAAEFLAFDVEHYPALWKVYGKAAGPIRNQRMLDQGRPELVIAFHHDLANSKGTKHMVEIARKAGVPVEVIG